MARAVRTPRSVVIIAVFAALVAAGALASAAVLRGRAADDVATRPPTSTSTPAAEPVRCRKQPCQVLGVADIRGVSVQLVADAGAGSGRLLVGGTTDSVIEVDIAGRGVVLGPDSLQCVNGTLAACLIRAQRADGSGVVGEVVVGRSDQWRRQETTYTSSAGYLGLTNISGDPTAEVVAVQYDCAGRADCAQAPVFVQVFTLTGTTRCSREYPRATQIPGWPTPKPAEGQLRACP